MLGTELLETLLASYAECYDIERDYPLQDTVYPAYAKFNATSAKYVLMKKAELWRVNCFEHAFFSVVSSLQTPLCQQIVEHLVRVVTVVGPGAGSVERAEEVVQRRVVRLPTRADRSAEGLGRGDRTQFLERGVRLALRIHAEDVLQRVADGVHPFLVVAVGVVANGEGLALRPGRDGFGFVPELLGPLGVVVKHLRTGKLCIEPFNDRCGELLRRLPRSGENHAGDFLAVDGHGDGLAAQRTGFPGELIEVLGNGDRLVLGRRLL